jgi:tungstate transport system substrate-binding protein
VRGLKDAVEALKRIAARQASFVSRGDKSGTDIMEKSLWAKARLQPQGRWYKEAGQGMGAVITMTQDLGGYTLADRGTYLSMKSNVSLQILVEGDPLLFNPYGIIAVNPARHPHVDYEGAMAYIAWFTSPEGQKVIGEFKVGGEVLFFPDAVK